MKERRNLTSEEKAMLSAPVGKPTPQWDSFQQTGAFAVSSAVPDDPELASLWAETPVQAGVEEGPWYPRPGEIARHFIPSVGRAVGEVWGLVNPPAIGQGLADLIPGVDIDEGEGFTEQQVQFGGLVSDLFRLQRSHGRARRERADARYEGREMPEPYKADPADYPYLAPMMKGLEQLTPLHPEHGWQGTHALSRLIEQEPAEFVFDLGLSATGIGAASAGIRGGVRVGRAARRAVSPLENLSKTLDDFDLLTGELTPTGRLRRATLDIEVQGPRSWDIRDMSRFGRRATERGTATVVSSTEAVTASHLLTGKTDAAFPDIDRVVATTYSGERIHVPTISGISPEADIAVLDLPGFESPLPLSIAADVREIDPLYGRRPVGGGYQEGVVGAEIVRDPITDAVLRETTYVGKGGLSGAGLVTETGELGGIYLGTVGKVDKRGMFSDARTVGAFLGQERPTFGVQDFDRSWHRQRLMERGLYFRKGLNFGDLYSSLHSWGGEWNVKDWEYDYEQDTEKVVAGGRTGVVEIEPSEVEIRRYAYSGGYTQYEKMLVSPSVEPTGELDPIYKTSVLKDVRSGRTSDPLAVENWTWEQLQRETYYGDYYRAEKARDEMLKRIRSQTQELIRIGPSPVVEGQGHIVPYGASGMRHGLYAERERWRALDKETAGAREAREAAGESDFDPEGHYLPSSNPNAPRDYTETYEAQDYQREAWESRETAPDVDDTGLLGEEWEDVHGDFDDPEWQAAQVQQIEGIDDGDTAPVSTPYIEEFGGSDLGIEERVVESIQAPGSSFRLETQRQLDKMFGGIIEKYEHDQFLLAGGDAALRESVIRRMDVRDPDWRRKMRVAVKRDRSFQTEQLKPFYEQVVALQPAGWEARGRELWYGGEFEAYYHHMEPVREEAYRRYQAMLEKGPVRRRRVTPGPTDDEILEKRDERRRQERAYPARMPSLADPDAYVETPVEIRQVEAARLESFVPSAIDVFHEKLFWEEAGVDAQKYKQPGEPGKVWYEPGVLSKEMDPESLLWHQRDVQELELLRQGQARVNLEAVGGEGVVEQPPSEIPLRPELVAKQEVAVTRAAERARGLHESYSREWRVAEAGARRMQEDPAFAPIREAIQEDLRKKAKRAQRQTLKELARAYGTTLEELAAARGIKLDSFDDEVFPLDLDTPRARLIGFPGIMSDRTYGLELELITDLEKSEMERALGGQIAQGLLIKPDYSIKTARSHIAIQHEFGGERQEAADYIAYQEQYTDVPGYEKVNPYSFETRYSHELVFPIMQGEQGIDLIDSTLRRLREFETELNTSMGMHIHVGAQDLSNYDLVGLWGAFAAREDVIDLMHEPSRRGEGSDYARSLLTTRDGYYEGDIFYTVPKLETARRESLLSGERRESFLNRVGYGNRYQKLNLRGHEHQTIEYRQPAPTLDIDEVAGHIGFITDFVDEFAGKPLAWASEQDLRLQQQFAGLDLAFERPSDAGQLLLADLEFHSRDVTSDYVWRFLSSKDRVNIGLSRAVFGSQSLRESVDIFKEQYPDAESLSDVFQRAGATEGVYFRSQPEGLDLLEHRSFDLSLTRRYRERFFLPKRVAGADARVDWREGEPFVTRGGVFASASAQEARRYLGGSGHQYASGVGFPEGGNEFRIFQGLELPRQKHWSEDESIVRPSQELYRVHESMFSSSGRFFSGGEWWEGTPVKGFEDAPAELFAVDPRRRYLQEQRLFDLELHSADDIDKDAIRAALERHRSPETEYRERSQGLSVFTRNVPGQVQNELLGFFTEKERLERQAERHARLRSHIGRGSDPEALVDVAPEIETVSVPGADIVESSFSTVDPLERLWSPFDILSPFDEDVLLDLPTRSRPMGVRQRWDRFLFESQGERGWGGFTASVAEMAQNAALINAAASLTVEGVRTFAGHDFNVGSLIHAGASTLLAGMATGLDRRFGSRGVLPESPADFAERREMLRRVNAEASVLGMTSESIPEGAASHLNRIFSEAGAGTARWGRGSLSRELSRYTHDDLELMFGSAGAETLQTYAEQSRRFGQKSYQTQRNWKETLLGIYSGDIPRATRYVYDPDTQDVSAVQPRRWTLERLLEKGEGFAPVDAWRMRREQLRLDPSQDVLRHVFGPLQTEDAKPHVGYMFLPESRGIGRFWGRFHAEPPKDRQWIKNWNLEDIARGIGAKDWADRIAERKDFRRVRGEILEERRLTPELYQWQDPDHFYREISGTLGIDVADFEGFGSPRLGDPYSRWGRYFSRLPEGAKYPLIGGGIGAGGKLAYDLFFGGEGEEDEPLVLDDPAGYSLSVRYPLLGALQRTRPYRRLRARVENLLDDLYGEDSFHGEMLKSIGLGKKGNLPREVKETFVQTGQIHALVQSGMHVSMFSSILGRYPALAAPAAFSAVRDLISPPDEFVVEPSQSYWDKYTPSDDPWTPRWNPDLPSQGQLRMLRSKGLLPADYEFSIPEPPSWAWWDPVKNYEREENERRQRKLSDIMDEGYLYIGTNVVNQRQYVGLSTRDPEGKGGRISKHLSGRGSSLIAEDLREGVKPHYFDFDVLAFKDISYYDLAQYEKQFIEQLGTQDGGYNISAGGEIRNPNYQYQERPDIELQRGDIGVADLLPWSVYGMFGVLPEASVSYFRTDVGTEEVPLKELEQGGARKPGYRIDSFEFDVQGSPHPGFNPWLDPHPDGSLENEGKSYFRGLPLHLISDVALDFGSSLYQAGEDTSPALFKLYKELEINIDDGLDLAETRVLLEYDEVIRGVKGEKSAEKKSSVVSKRSSVVSRQPLQSLKGDVSEDGNRLLNRRSLVEGYLPFEVSIFPEEEKVDLNMGSVSNFERLGFSSEQAESLISHRVVFPFEDVSDILDVRGIGKKTLQRVRPGLTVRGGSPFEIDTPVDLSPYAGVDARESVVDAYTAEGMFASPDTSLFPADAFLNLKTATAEQLESLPNIGSVTAGRILKYREEHPGMTPADLSEVHGISQGTEEKLSKFFEVSPLNMSLSPVSPGEQVFQQGVIQKSPIHFQRADDPMQRVVGSKLDLRSATVGQLEGLPGIGRTLAERIIDYREDYPMMAPSQLSGVQGISQKHAGELAGYFATSSDPFVSITVPDVITAEPGLPEVAVQGVQDPMLYRYPPTFAQGLEYEVGRLPEQLIRGYLKGGSEGLWETLKEAPMKAIQRQGLRVARNFGQDFVGNILRPDQGVPLDLKNYLGDFGGLSEKLGGFGEKAGGFFQGGWGAAIAPIALAAGTAWIGEQSLDKGYADVIPSQQQREQAFTDYLLGNRDEIGAPGSLGSEMGVLRAMKKALREVLSENGLASMGDFSTRLSRELRESDSRGITRR